MSTNPQTKQFLIRVCGSFLIIWVALWLVTILGLSREVDYVERLCHFREVMGNSAFVAMGYVRGTQSESVKRAGQKK